LAFEQHLEVVMPHVPTHAVVWLDHREAKVFLVTAEDVESKRINAHAPHRQVHHKANEVGSGHVRDDRKYFEAILAAIEDADSWLIAGPAGTKKDLEKYLDGHGEELKKRLVGVVPMDHPTDNELLAHARTLFKAHDRMAPQDPRIARAMRGGTARG
jgi:stalled ribosome rescue protein Dom34